MLNTNSTLKSLRKAKGISQEEAAKCIGISLSSYQKYEREKNSVMPSIDVLIKLADFYDVTTDYLLGIEPKQSCSLNVDDDKFISIYRQLPDYAKQIFMETIIALSKAVSE